jgi:hypothetical protein
VRLIEPKQKHGPFGWRLWRPGPAIANDRPMPERRLRLAGDRALSMRDESELAAERYPQGAGYADLEVRAVVPMLVVRHASLQAAGSHDQVD